MVAAALVIAAQIMLAADDPVGAQMLLSATGWEHGGPDYGFVRYPLAQVRAGLAALALDQAADRGRALGLDRAVDEALARLATNGT